MPGFKITRFLGIAPKISPELLPETAGQVAHNCKLYSGDLIPFTQPVYAGNTGRTGEVKTLFALRDPTTGLKKWLSWITDVDVVIASETNKDEQRFYYTGDGAPKVSNYKLATTGLSPYPVNYYDLGLPVPEDNQKLITTAATYTPKTTYSYSRDTSNVVTIVTTEPHGLRTGNFVSISGFSYINGTYSQSNTTITVTISNHGLSEGAQVTLDFTSGTAPDGVYTITNVTANTFDVYATSAQSTNGDVRLDIRNLNVSNAEIIVIDNITFTYFSPGPAIATTPSSAGKVELGGLKQARSYVFTWYTPWGEESIASKPSDELFVKEGTTVVVASIPFIPPYGNNFIRGVRLYRKLSSLSGSDYFLLSTLWFPNTLTSVQRTANVSRVTTVHPHNLGIDERFKIKGCSVSSFDITDGVVTNVIDDYTFEYDQIGVDISITSVSAGALYYDVSENPPITSARYWGDPDGNYWVFVDDFDSRNLFTVLASDDYDPPPKDLKGLTLIQNSILCGFVGNTLYFSEPKLPHAWPAKYALSLEYNIVGLAPVGGSLLVLTDSYPYLVSGPDPASGMSVSRIDANYPCLSKRSILAMSYGIVYATNDGLAVYSTASGPAIITKLLFNNDTWQTELDPSTIVAKYYGDSYFASHSTGAFVFEHDPKIGGFFVTADQRFTAAWYDSADGVLYFIPNTNGDVYKWNDLGQPSETLVWKSKVIKTETPINFGAARIIADFDGEKSVVFRFWVDKELLFETTISDDRIFRLPSGYLSDTFEIGVESNIRIRAIHIAETPTKLAEL